MEKEAVPGADPGTDPGADPGPDSLRRELASARQRLRELEYLLEAIRTGQADALVIQGERGAEIRTLNSLDLLIDSIIDHSIGAALLVDKRGRILRCSPLAAEMLQSDPVGLHFDAAFPLDLAPGDPAPEPGSAPDGGRERFAIGGILEGRIVHGREAAFLRDDGTSFSLLVAAKPLSAYEGLFEGAVVNLVDITPRKRAEMQAEVRLKQLRYQLELTQSITDNLDEALFLLDAEGRILFANPAAEGLLGRPVAELLGEDLHRLAHPGHAGDRASPCPLDGRSGLADGPMQGEDEFERPSGGPVAVRWSMAPVRSEERRTGTVLAAADVSQRKRAEEALRLSEEKLIQSQKMEAVGRLAGGIAHDFNNLLTAINGFTSISLAALEEASPIRGYLEQVERAGRRAATLTSQLLAYSRKQILCPKVVDLNRLVEETSSILRRTLEESVVHELDLQPDGCRAKVDPVHFQQALVNIAINARDAMPDGGTLRIATRIVRAESPDRSGLVGEMAREADARLEPGTYNRVTVSDTGHGMDDGVKSRLFEPFFTTKGVGSGPSGRTGSGLGLSMVYGIMKQSKGHIQVFSEPGKGTTLHLFLPLAPGPPPAAAPRGGVPGLPEPEAVLAGEGGGS